MPYVRYEPTKAGVAVYKKTASGKMKKAFTAHTRSVAEAKRTAAARERAAHAHRGR